MAELEKVWNIIKKRNSSRTDRTVPYGYQIGITGGMLAAGLLLGLLPAAWLRVMGGMLVSAGACAALAVFVWDVCCLTGLRDGLRGLKRRELVHMLCFVVLTNLFLFLFVHAERYVRFWDQAAYWKRTIQFMETLFANPPEALRWTWYTINHAEYNMLIPLFLAAPMKLTGISFFSFVFWVWNLFSVPAVLLMELLLKKICAGYRIGCLAPLAAPMLLMIVVMGFGDAPGFLFVLLAIALLADGVYYERFCVAHCFCVFASVMGAMLSRRYFALFGVGYVAGVLVSYAAAGRRDGKVFLKNLLCTGLFAALGFLACHGFVRMSLFSDYGQQYAAYRTGGPVENFVRALWSFGAVAVLLALYGLWHMIRNKTGRHMGLLLAVQAVITSLAVFSIQDLYIQHYYLLIPAVLIPELYGLHVLAGRRNRLGVCVAGVLLLLNFSNSFLDFSLPAPVSWLCSSQIRTPQVRHDMNQLGLLAEDLNHLLGNDAGNTDWSASQSRNGKTVYCTASSDILNSEVLRHLKLPQKLESVPGLLPTYDVDLRDGFPAAFLTADYLVVTDPSQYHLSREGQRVVVLLNEAVSDGPLSGHYRQLNNTYTLDGGVTVRLYERISPYEEEDIQYLRRMFGEYYEDFPELFEERIVLPGA